MKLAATVILYHPPENVLENIATYYEEVELLYVFDNTEQSFCRSWFDGFEKVVFLHDGDNKGIAQRLNEGCSAARKAGYDRMLTMDQDSRFPPGTFATYLHCIARQTHSEMVAVYGMQYRDYEVLPSQNCQPKPTPFIITSGMLLNLAITSAIGGFDEQLFIDAVDHEYCLRAKQHGYETVQFGNILLHHTEGNAIKRASIKTLYLVKKAKVVHSPLRCYYMYRNSLYLAQKYRQLFPDLIAYNDKVVQGILNRNFWYGGSAWQTLGYILRAKRDFRKGRMGKIR